MIAELITCVVIVLAVGAEMLHVLRVRRLAPLAFGPSRQPVLWAYSAPMWRVAAIGALCWGFVTLLILPPKVHMGDEIPENKRKHVVLVLDVSPSMRLQDAGPSHEQSRMQRSADVLESYFDRVGIGKYRISVVATYNGAKPVLIDTTDVEVVRNALTDLPMHHAFVAGETDIFAGLEEAARIARPWQPRSTTVILISDGDTVPATGMPRMPASVSGVLVVGIGDSRSGSFINGRQSRQDASTLRQIAARLDGFYHNANEKHVATATLEALSGGDSESVWEALTKREWAIIACTLGSLIYAFLPMLLHYAGTMWQPGVRQPEVVKETVSIAASEAL